MVSGDLGQLEGGGDLLNLELEPQTPKSTKQRKSTRNPPKEDRIEDDLANLEQDLHGLDSDNNKQKDFGRAGQKSKVRRGKKKS